MLEIKIAGINPTISYLLVYGTLTCIIAAMILNNSEVSEVCIYISFYMVFTYILLYGHGKVEQCEHQQLYGDHWGFGGYCAALILSAIAVWSHWSKTFPFAVSIWGPPQNWQQIEYLVEYKYLSFQICKVALWIASSIWSYVAILLGSLVLWLVQRRLLKQHARILLIFSSALVISVGFVLVMSIGDMILVIMTMKN